MDIRKEIGLYLKKFEDVNGEHSIQLPRKTKLYKYVTICPYCNQNAEFKGVKEDVVLCRFCGLFMYKSLRNRWIVYMPKNYNADSKSTKLDYVKIDYDTLNNLIEIHEASPFDNVKVPNVNDISDINKKLKELNL